MNSATMSDSHENLRRKSVSVNVGGVSVVSTSPHSCPVHD